MGPESKTEAEGTHPSASVFVLTAPNQLDDKSPAHNNQQNEEHQNNSCRGEAAYCAGTGARASVTAAVSTA